MDERVYQIALSVLNGLGPVKAKTLLAEVDDVESVFTEKITSLKKIQGINSVEFDEAERKRALNRAQQELEFIEENNIQLYYFRDPNYPTKLKQCYDAPIVLFTLGKVNFKQKNIAIVGTRKSTSYGKKMTDKLVEDLSVHNVQIVSGLAHGIDRFAHEAALHNDLSTLGVLGHGLDTMYPAAHRPLAKRMLENGGLVTEYITGIVGDPGNFPRRNRIVAGLCDATVVVESSESGGSMITANLANDYNREVFAFPGHVDRNSSKGCNNLIKRNRAHLITEAEDLVKILGWVEGKSKSVDQEEVNIELEPQEEKIVDLIREKGDLDIDNLVLESELDSSDISLHLFNLEMKGLVRSMPGKRYGLV